MKIKKKTPNVVEIINERKPELKEIDSSLVSQISSPEAKTLE